MTGCHKVGGGARLGAPALPHLTSTSQAWMNNKETVAGSEKEGWVAGEWGIACVYCRVLARGTGSAKAQKI